MPPLVALVAPDANDGALFSGRGPKIAPPPGEGDDPEARSWPDVTPETPSPTDRPTTYLAAAAAGSLLSRVGVFLNVNRL